MKTLTLNLATTAVQQPITIAVDVGGSMHGDALDVVQREAIRFQKECSAHPVLGERLQVQFVTFGGSVSVTPFTPITSFQPPTLCAGGLTPMAEAVLASIKATEDDITLLREVGELEIDAPMFFMFSDGVSTSSPELMQLASEAVRQIERAGRGEFYGFGVDSQAVNALQPLFVRQVERLEGVNFRKFFNIISASVRHVSCRAIGERRDVQRVIRGFLEGPQNDRDS